MNKAILKTLDEFLRHLLGDEEVWSKVLLNAGIEPRAGVEPDPETAETLLESAAEIAGMERGALLEGAGHFIAPRLLDRLHLRRPESVGWKCLDIVENMPDLLHGLEKGAPQPSVETRSLRLRYGEAAMVVLRPRGVCALLRGVLQEISHHTDEPLAMEEHLCQWQGAILCRFTLTLDDPQLMRVVDVRREFETARNQGGVIRFFNRFQGVPVVSGGELLRIGHEEVTFRLPRQQLLAMQLEEQTFLALPHLNTGLNAKVGAIEMEASTVVLHKVESTGGAMGLRSTDRVEPPYPIVVEFTLGDQLLRGQLMDISSGGLSMVVRQDAWLTEEDLFASLELSFKLQSAPPVMRRSGEKLKTAIRWMDGDADSEALEVTVMGNLLDLVLENDVKLMRVVFAAPAGRVLELIENFVNQRREAAFQSLNRKP